MKHKDNKINGLNKRHVAQIIGIKTTEKTQGDNSKYNRKRNKNVDLEDQE